MASWFFCSIAASPARPFRATTIFLSSSSPSIFALPIRTWIQKYYQPTKNIIKNLQILGGNKDCNIISYSPVKSHPLTTGYAAGSRDQNSPLAGGSMPAEVSAVGLGAWQCHHWRGKHLVKHLKLQIQGKKEA